MFARWCVQRICALIVALLPTLVWGQANVNESVETAFIYVDVNNGSDSNPGTASQPLQTIGAAASQAMSNNQTGVGSRVIINPGSYRESVSIAGGSRSTDLPITFEAATNGTVFVSGTDVWTNWSVYGGNPDIYTHAWPYQWGVCPASVGAPLQQEIMLRQEMIIVNGTPLTEVLSLTAMRPATFFPDEANAIVYVWPPSGTDMATATVEVATQPTLFTDNGQSNIVLRGLTFQYANSCHGDVAVSISSNATNVLIDSDNFLWNNAMGLAFTEAQNFTVQSSVANHNGQKGFATHEVKYGLWQSDTANYNNWRGAQGAFYGWDTTGAKFMWDHDGTFNNLTVLFNQARGLGFDTDNENVTVTSLLSAANLTDSFSAEKSEGPMTFSNSYFCANNPLNMASTGGFLLRNSSFVSLTGSAIFGNGQDQLFVNGYPGGYIVTNWETGQVYNLRTENLTLSEDTIAGGSTAQVFSDDLGNTDWDDFVSTLNSDHNTWWAGTNANAFTVPTSDSGTAIDLAGWQALTGQDMNSSWASASSPTACDVQSQGPDYWFVTADASPVTASPAGSASYSLATMPLGGMTGTIDLSVDGLAAIPGVTASFNPPSVGTLGASELTLTTLATTPVGSYPVTIIANSGSVTHTITVSLIVPQTSVRLSTTSLAFGNQADGTTSSPQTVTLTNTGNTALAISNISAGYNFAQTNTCGASLPAGTNCTISVTFSPGQVQTYAESLLIKDADPTSPQMVTLSGVGLASPNVEVLPPSLAFGAHKVGTSTTETVTLDNKGSAALTIRQMTITGTSKTDFSQTNNCGSSLAASASCTIQVKFSPSAAGQDSATLTIYDNNSMGTKQTVSLNGGGT